MLFRLFRRKLAADKSGAAAIEFAFVAIGLVLFTLAIIDVGFALFWFNRAEKATQLGVRVASVSNPVTDYLSTLSGTEGGVAQAGEGCESPTGTLEPFCDHDNILCEAPLGTIASLACENESNAPVGNLSSAAFSKIFNEMRTLYPQLRSSNVQVEYRPSIAGFAARPGGGNGEFNIVPQVTVRIVNLTYNYIALGSLLGLAPLNLPVISASANGEDLNHTNDL